MAEFVYSGQENLEAMKEADNYNRYLIGLITKVLDDEGISYADARVLDFGAGIGTYADMLKEKGIVVDCLELDKDQVDILEEKGYVVYQDISSIKDKYDLVYALNVFEHIENDHDVFASVTKVLKRDGSVLIYVPAIQSAFSSMDTLVGHHRRYNLARLEEMSTRAGMHVQSLEYAEPIGLLAAYLYKFIGNKNGSISKSSVRFYDTVAFPLSKVISPVFRKIGGKNAILIASRTEK